jgi:hypothetical protein
MPPKQKTNDNKIAPGLDESEFDIDKVNEEFFEATPDSSSTTRHLNAGDTAIDIKP